MRKGVLAVELTPDSGDVVRLASRMYADSNTLFRGHLQGFTQTRKMTDVFSGLTSMSIANLVVHNQNEEYDSTLFAGTADIRIGDDSDAFADMTPVMLDAPVELTARTDNEISIAVLDGQSRGNTKQQRIFDTIGYGLGTLLPEIWGRAYKFPLITLDGDTGTIYGCAGPLTSLAAVYVDEIEQVIATSSAVGALTDTTGYAIADTIITLASAGTGSLVIGDKIVFDGDPNEYQLAEGDTNVVNGGTFEITAPGLIVALPASSVAITVVTHTTSITGNMATVTFAVKPQGNVYIDASGLGATLPGALLDELLTRIATVCQGWVMSSSGNDITLDERIDDASETLVGKVFQLLRGSGILASTRNITAFNSATRTITHDGAALSAAATANDMYSIAVNTTAGGFTTSQIDSTGFDALDTALPYDFGLVASNGISAIRLQDQLLSPLLCHMAPRRDGIVQLKRLALPVAPAVTKITRIIGKISRSPLPIYWQVEARYRRDNTGDHWRTITASDASIKATYPTAKTITLDVPIQGRVGAKLIAEHWIACFGQSTELASMTVDHDLSGLDLGDVVEVFDDRYQFAGGKLAVVVSMTDVFDGHDELGVWVKSQ